MDQAGKDFWQKVSKATDGSFETIGAADVLTLESVIFAAIGERAKAQGITYSY